MPLTSDQLIGLPCGFYLIISVYGFVTTAIYLLPAVNDSVTNQWNIAFGSILLDTADNQYVRLTP